MALQGLREPPPVNSKKTGTITRPAILVNFMYETVLERFETAIVKDNIIPFWIWTEHSWIKFNPYCGRSRNLYLVLRLIWNGANIILILLLSLLGLLTCSLQSYSDG